MAFSVTLGEGGSQDCGVGGGGGERVLSRGGTEPNFFLTEPHLPQVENRQGGTCNRPERDDGHLDQGGGRGGDGKWSASRYRLGVGPTEFRVTRKWKQLGSTCVFGVKKVRDLVRK